MDEEKSWMNWLAIFCQKCHFAMVSGRKRYRYGFLIARVELQ
jgi:3-phenylpropionate/cinnamic acid dioxygenase small subunit